MTSNNRMNNFKRMVDRMAVGGKLLTTQEKSPRDFWENHPRFLETHTPFCAWCYVQVKKTCHNKGVLIEEGG